MKSISKRSMFAGIVFTMAATSGGRLAMAEPPLESRAATPVGVIAEAPKDPGVKPSPVAPDNSERNVQDQDDRTLTPTDQSNEPADIEMTQKIRKGITSNDAMSMQARNIKIITQGGVVTLRGPVKTTQEKAAIETLAKNAGATRIDNQLEIDRDMPSGEKG
jgi:hyperosmotically inducible protein